MIIYPTPKPAVLAAITILQDAFGAYASVSADLPARNRPTRFVHVERGGGGRDNPVTDTARIIIGCFAPDTEQAEAMTGTVCAAFSNAQGTTVTTTKGDIFIRKWADETIVGNFPHPDVIDRKRWLVHGDLAVKSN